MKKRLLSNRVRNAILMAILLQSVIFGIGLMVTGTFSGTANPPLQGNGIPGGGKRRAYIRIYE
ncbi:MAG: hypothetical protein ACLTBV_06495 [Enterocloster bolteae]